MKHIKRETQVVAYEQDLRLGAAALLDSTESPDCSWHVPVKAKKLSISGRISSYFKGEYAFLTASADITLEQLYQKLMLAESKDRIARTKFQEMMYVMASDIRRAKDSPLAGVPTDVARSMSAWRERYNELDRYLAR